MKFNKEMLTLYAVTDRAWEGKQTLYEQIEDALRGGVTVLQLREKNLSFDAFVVEAVKVKKICEKYGVPLIINDNVKVAVASGADGVHVGIEDMPIEEIRRIVPKNFIIGATAKTQEQARDAESAGADYLGVGAVFPSPTKQTALRITVEELRKITSSVNIPAVAIGGINGENALQIKNSGVCGIAVVSAIFAATDVYSATCELKKTAIEVIS